MTNIFTPNSADLMSMIATASAKCDADIEQSKLRKEAIEQRKRIRAQEAEQKAKYYARIQLGVVR